MLRELENIYNKYKTVGPWLFQPGSKNLIRSYLVFFLFWNKLKSIQQGCIKLSKSYSKYIYNITQDLYKISNTFLFLKLFFLL